MINVLIQILVLVNALLINFFVPLLFGLESYGLFIKTNILVLFFHKCLDLASEPLINLVDKNLCFVISLTLGIIVFIFFYLVNLLFNLSSSWLLAAMIWSNCILLTLYAHQQRFYILWYLFYFNSLFLTLLFLSYFEIIYLSINQILIITNLISPTCFLVLLLKKNDISIKWAHCSQEVSKILQLFPQLFSLTLVNNLFTNVLPFYFSFILPPQALGLFKVQVSITQSVTAIFPINNKVITAHLKTNSSDFLVKITNFSLNYFYGIALSGIVLVNIIKPNNHFAGIFLIMPILHLAIIFERALLGKQQKKALITINWFITIIISGLSLSVRNIDQIMVVYSAGIALYLLLIVSRLSFSRQWLVILLVLLTPIEIYLSYQAVGLSVICLVFNILIVIKAAPINKGVLSVINL